MHDFTPLALPRLLARLLPTGIVGMSVALAPPADAAPVPPPHTPAAEGSASVAARLQGIRDAVSQAVQTQGDLEDAQQPNILKAWWGNGGARRGWGWGNGGWHNGGWGNGWHNGGWGNGGWHNGGWGNWHGW